MRIFGIEGFGPGQEDIAVLKIQSPGIAKVIIMVRYRPDDFGGDLHFEHVAIGFFEEQDFFAVVGPIEATDVALAFSEGNGLPSGHGKQIDLLVGVAVGEEGERFSVRGPFWRGFRFFRKSQLAK